MPKPNKSMKTVKKIMNNEPVRGLSGSDESMLPKVGGDSVSPGRMESYLRLRSDDMGYRQEY
jgi:hypothetical protein